MTKGPMDPDRYQMRDIKRRLSAAERHIRKLRKELDRQNEYIKSHAIFVEATRLTEAVK